MTCRARKRFADELEEACFVAGLSPAGKFCLAVVVVMSHRPSPDRMRRETAGSREEIATSRAAKASRIGTVDGVLRRWRRRSRGATVPLGVIFDRWRSPSGLAVLAMASLAFQDLTWQPDPAMKAETESRKNGRFVLGMKLIGFTSDS